MYSPSTWWVLHGSCMLKSCCCQRTSIGESPTCLGYLPKGAKISVWRYPALSRTVREILMLGWVSRFYTAVTRSGMQEASFEYKKIEDSSYAEFCCGKQTIIVLTWLFFEVHHQYLQSSKGQHRSVLCTGKRANWPGFGNVWYTEMFKKTFSDELTLFYRLRTTISY